MPSLVKFIHRRSGGARGNLYWNRAHVDGLPFRGFAPPNMTEEEYEQRVRPVADPHNATFDTSDPKQNQAYLEVLDGWSNDWYRVVYLRRWRRKGRIFVYVEWLEYCMEDGHPAPSPQHLPMEMSHGRQNGYGSP